MTFDDSLGESLHVALRKACDSTATSAAWNALHLMPKKEWSGLLGCVRVGFKDYVLPENLTDRQAEKILGEKLKEIVLGWKPYGKGHASMTAFCIFELFDNNEWTGFASFLPYSIEKEVAA